MLADFPQESQQVVEDCIIFSHRLEMTLGNFLVVRNRSIRQRFAPKANASSASSTGDLITTESHTDKMQDG